MKIHFWPKTEKKRKWPNSQFSAPKTKASFGRLLVWWLDLSDPNLIPSDFTTDLRHWAGWHQIRRSFRARVFSHVDFQFFYVALPTRNGPPSTPCLPICPVCCRIWFIRIFAELLKNCVSPAVITQLVETSLFERVVSVWNSLPCTVDFSSLASFKGSVTSIDFSVFLRYIQAILMCCIRKGLLWAIVSASLLAFCPPHVLPGSTFVTAILWLSFSEQMNK